MQDAEGDDIEEELLQVAQCDTVEEPAEQDLEANMPADLEAGEEEGVQHETEVHQEDVEMLEEESADEADPVQFDDCAVTFICGEIASAGSSDKVPEVVAPKHASFQESPAFKLLESLEMTELPNVAGCGLALHGTINMWQLRYPASEPGEKMSCARSWGELPKKGYVSCCKALVQVLLWGWERHAAEHPECAVAKQKISLLQGALVADIGRDLK